VAFGWSLVRRKKKARLHMKIEKSLSVLRVVIVGMSSLSNFNEIGQLIVLAKI